MAHQQIIYWSQQKPWSVLHCCWISKQWCLKHLWRHFQPLKALGSNCFVDCGKSNSLWVSLYKAVFQLISASRLNAWWLLLVRIKAMIIVVLWNCMVPLWCSKAVWNCGRWSCCSELLCSQRQANRSRLGFPLGFSQRTFPLTWTQPHDQCFRPSRTKILELVITSGIACYQKISTYSLC